MAAPTISNRPFSGREDVIAIHAFLSRTIDRCGSASIWEVRRWEGRWWHDDPSDVERQLEASTSRIRIWEDTGGEIVAVAHPEGPGDVHLEIAPGHERLADEMLAWAETSALPRSIENGGRELTTFALDTDAARRRVLSSRGYEELDWGEIHRWRHLDDAVPARPVADGYRLHSLVVGDRDDATRLADLINASFGHAFGPEALLNFEHAPSYVPECQIVAVAPDGTHAAHAGVTIDRAIGLATVEPVCTHPDHRRLGLAGACIAEALERARGLGAVRAKVSTGTGNPSDRLYEQLGFTDLVEHAGAWRIALP
jgi:GNAT superfamily N-acetyltransferase